MDIIQGPLPLDGTSVNPAEFLETWISGTSVYNFGPTQFKGGSLQFVYSNTEPPPLDTRFPGMLWFKRGEGRLYSWDYSDDPCGPSSANTGDINWISLSDRRDVWLQSIESAPPGSQFFPAATPSGPYFNMLQPTGISYSYDPYNGRVVWAVSLFATSSCGTDIRGNMTGGISWIALETTVSGAKFRAAEFGFVDMMVGCGCTSLYGPLKFDVLATDVRRFDALAYTMYSGGGGRDGLDKWCYCGHLTNDPAGATAYAADAPYLRQGWKWHHSYWQPTGGV